PPSPPEGRPWAPSRAPLWLSSGMGPLATLGDGLWRQLSGDRGAEKSSSPRLPRDRAPPLGMRGGPLFVHERLRELSRKPLPMWPVFLAAYVAVPALVFIVLPAHIDMYWLQVGPRPSASGVE
ncbi:unnamed protein product, partial [Polarella glacialis]